MVHQPAGSDAEQPRHHNRQPTDYGIHFLRLLVTASIQATTANAIAATIRLVTGISLSLCAVGFYAVPQLADQLRSYWRCKLFRICHAEVSEQFTGLHDC